MHFDNFEAVEYNPITLYDVVFELRFPHNLRIQSQRPVLFQEAMIKKGYTEFVQGSIPEPVGPIQNDLPDDIRVFQFLTKEGDWECAFNRSSFSLRCLENYVNYKNFRERLEDALKIFCDIHMIPYFTRVGLMCRNMVNTTFLPNLQIQFQDLIPNHIFPILNTEISNDISELRATSVFDDGEIRSVAMHTLAYASGIFGKKNVSDKQSYVVEIDCSCEKNMEVNIDEILTKCDRFRELEWKIFQWSISESLREFIGILSDRK